MARRLALVLSTLRQRPTWSSGFLTLTSGKRPKLMFMGWKLRAPA
jgi:hypothetical protein